MSCDWQGPEGGKTPLVAAAENGHHEVAALLLAKGASLDKAAMTDDGDNRCGLSLTPLSAAAWKGHLKSGVAAVKGCICQPREQTTRLDSFDRCGYRRSL